MGIKTTYDIERELAITIIRNRLDGATNEGLADMLEAFPESYNRNYRVYDELKDTTFSINDESDFNNL